MPHYFWRYLKSDIKNMHISNMYTNTHMALQLNHTQYEYTNYQHKKLIMSVSGAFGIYYYLQS